MAAIFRDARAAAALSVLAFFTASAVAQVPPAKAPPISPAQYTVPVVIYDASGNVVSSFGGGSGGSGGGTVYQGGTWTFGLSGPIPAGSNVIGGVTQSGGPWAINGAVTATLNQGGSALSSSNPIFVQVTNLLATQPVSAVSLPLPSGAATAALQSSVQTAAGTSALSLVSVQGSASGVPIPVSGSVAISNLPATQQVTGTVIANQGTSPWSISGAVTQSGAWTVAQGAPGGAAWKVDGSGVTQPVSGAVSVSNFPASQVVTNGGAFAVQNTASIPAGANNIGTIGNAFALDATVTARLGTLGQKAASGSAPVVIASDQSSLPAKIDQTTPGTTNGVVVNSVNRAIFYSEAAAASAAANASVNGTDRDAGFAAGAAGNYPYLQIFVTSTQSGTLYWFATDTAGSGYVLYFQQAIAANTPTTVKLPVNYRYGHATFTNGATAGTVTMRNGYLVN